MAEQLGVAYSTAQRAVDRLVALSILTEITRGKRDRVYCAGEILEILEEPADLRPPKQD